MKLNEKQLQQVDAQVKRLLKSGSFYGEVYRCLLYTSNSDYLRQKVRH